MPNYLKEKEELIQIAQEIDKRSFVFGEQGSISLRTDDKKYIIMTPKEIEYTELTHDNLSVLDVNGEFISGKKPAIESKIHTKIYQNREDINSIIHTHSVYATAMSSLRITIPVIFDEMAAILGGEIKTAEYGLPGSEQLADNCFLGLQDKMAVLLANHGAISTGKTGDKALKTAITLEKVLKQFILAKSVGSPISLDSKYINYMRNFFEEYEE